MSSLAIREFITRTDIIDSANRDALSRKYKINNVLPHISIKVFPGWEKFLCDAKRTTGDTLGFPFRRPSLLIIRTVFSKE